MLHIEVSELADRQIGEADRWWQQNRLKAPNAIREELERIGALLAFRPHLGARAVNVKLPGIRRIHIERIHYDVYYRVVGSPEYIEIVAFWASRRRQRSSGLTARPPVREQQLSRTRVS